MEVINSNFQYKNTNVMTIINRKHNKTDKTKIKRNKTMGAITDKISEKFEIYLDSLKFSEAILLT